MYGWSFDSGIDFDKPLWGTSQLLEQQERDEAYEDLPANHFVIDSLTFWGMGNQSGPTPGVCLFYAFMFAENQCWPSSSQERTDLLWFLRESLGSNKRHIASRKYLEYELAYARLNGFGDVSEKEASFLVGLCVAVKMFWGDFPGSGTRIGSAPKWYANLADQYLAAAEQEWAWLLFDVSWKSLRPTKDPYWDEHYWDALGRSAERPDNDVT